MGTWTVEVVDTAGGLAVLISSFLLKDIRWVAINQDGTSFLGNDWLSSQSRGVIVLPGTRFTTEELQQQRWILRPSTERNSVASTEVQTRTLLDGSILIQFQGYTPIPNENDIEITSPEIEILVMIREGCPEALYVTKMNHNTIKKNGGSCRAPDTSMATGVARLMEEVVAVRVCHEHGHECRGARGGLYVCCQSLPEFATGMVAGMAKLVATAVAIIEVF
ncbi:hypothetical protein ZIOFF_002008 [Zingiber officinale]|uniref:Uncharacterized protein n=1 Tax=Zingiber officinale TaxID=94328 RepID=A0A8J5IL88_ZINOF|nr:hypothetical protein ZIOFF_002008 [Zingiber officinale]